MSSIAYFLNLTVLANLYGLTDMSTGTSTISFRQTSSIGFTQPHPQLKPLPTQLDLDLQSEHISTWSLNVVPQRGPSMWSLNLVVPQLVPSTWWSLNWVPQLGGPSTRSLNLVPQLYTVNR